MRGLSLVATSGGHSSSRCAGLSLLRPLLLRSTSSGCAGSVIVVHGPSRSAACGILPDQGWNPCPLHWQADSQPLRHQGSPLRMAFDPYEEEGANYIQRSGPHSVIVLSGPALLEKASFSPFLMLMALSQMILLLQDVLCAKNHKLC